MRRVTGLTPRVLDRRGVAVDRLVLLGMTRDGFAETPGASINLFLGERTQYRDAAWITDAFDRPTLDWSGPWPDAMVSPGPITYGALELVEDGGAVTVPATVTLSAPPFEFFETHPVSLPRDQWVQYRLVDFATTPGDDASYISAGLGVRMSAPTDAMLSGYLVYIWGAQNPLGHFLQVGKYVDGVQVDPANYFGLLEVSVQAGDIVRVEAEWATLRVYQNGVLILEETDTDEPILTGGHGALEGFRVLETDEMTVTDFAAGPLRQEYVGLLADVGDVTAGLGLLEPTASPHAWTISLVNCAPIGGADRFAGLLRHGLNAGPRTFDIYRQPVRVVQAYR